MAFIDVRIVIADVYLYLILVFGSLFRVIIVWSILLVERILVEILYVQNSLFLLVLSSSFFVCSCDDHRSRMAFSRDRLAYKILFRLPCR